MKQIKVTVWCDEGYVADSLRTLAAAYEDDMDRTEYETYEFYATIDEEC